MLIALIPILLFFALDAYYLALERWFRESYQAFVMKLHKGTASIEDVFVLPPKGRPPNMLSETADAAVSPSVLPFYLVLAALLAIVGWKIS